MNELEQQRRAYWAEQMELAHAFMNEIMEYPYQECGEGLVPLADVARDAKLEVAFSQSQVAPGLERQFYIRQGLVDQYLAAASALNSFGLILKVEDAYRSPEMQKQLSLREGIFDIVMKRVIWELEGKKPDARIIRRRLGALTALYPKVATHMSGSALDISVLSRDTGKELDRGAPYLELSEITPMGCPFVGGECRDNREKITALMAKHGFAAYPFEFWHYSSGDAIAQHVTSSGKPGCYGPVIRNVDNSVTPVAEPKRSTIADEELTARIAEALEKLAG
jgi:zinc D-Ala-D-Ala dipeptidase